MNYVEVVRDRALKELPVEIGKYIERAAGNGRTQQANRRAYARYQLIPRALQGVANPSLNVEVFGASLAMPLLIAPTAWHSLYHPAGEAAMSLAARNCGTNFILSCFSSMSYESLREKSGSSCQHIWQQLLIHKDEEVLKRSIERAYQTGCSAIVLTVDAPSGCRMCKADGSAYSKVVGYPPDALPLLPRFPDCRATTLDQYYESNLDARSVTWDRVRHLVHSSPLPIVLKGILAAEDAVIAKEIGAAGIIISNHGGRQMDGCISTLEALQRIREHMDSWNKSPFEVYLDGGIRSGQDILKALCLGARAVSIGRPALYALATEGQIGVENMLRSLSSDLSDRMRELGCGSLAELRERDWITRSPIKIVR